MPPGLSVADLMVKTKTLSVIHTIKAGKELLKILIKLLGFNESRKENCFSNSMIYIKRSGANIAVGSLMNMPIMIGSK